MVFSQIKCNLLHGRLAGTEARAGLASYSGCASLARAVHLSANPLVSIQRMFVIHHAP